MSNWSGCSDYKATIVVPVLKQKDEWLRQALVSAIKQTVPTEVIVVVSEDTPRENHRTIIDLIGRYNNLFVCFDEGSFASAINIGFQKAKTDRVGILLSDDWLEEDAIEKCLPRKVDIVSTGMNFTKASGISRRKRLVHESTYDKLATLWEKASYLKHFFLFQREKVLLIGGVDNKIGLTGPDDFDMIWTLLENGATVSLVSEPLYNYRDHLECRLSLRSKEDQIIDLKKILVKHKVSEEEQEVVLAKKSRWLGVTVEEGERQR